MLTHSKKEVFMKKIFKTLILLLLVTFSLVGCTQKQFDGKWNFKDITDVEIAPSYSEDLR